MRRTVVVLLVLVSLGLLGADAASAARAHVADGKLGDWRGRSTALAGHSITSRGEYIYTDWLYDDYGPDLNGGPDRPAFRASLAPTRGDYRYPAEPARYGYNAADLRELRVAADGKTLHLLIALQTMKVADAAAVQVAIDWDHDDATSAPGGAWPDGSGIVTKGPSHFITTTGNSAHVSNRRGRVHTVHSVANTKANAIEVDVPLRLLQPFGENPRIWVVTGLNDGHGKFKSQTLGAPAVFNAGFRRESYASTDDDPNRLGGSEWSENNQAATLAKGDIKPFHGSFDLGRLRAGASDPRPAIKPGKHVRIFRSKKDYGEGIDLKTEQSNVGGNPRPEFLSRYQPYALYIPKGYDPGGRNVLTLDGHSLDCSHLQFFNVSPNQERQLGDERKSILVTPLARGADTWYMNAGLVDTIEAWNDVRRHYRVDDERTFITGYSMGGYMTYRLGLLMPDRFVKASVWVGPPAYQLWPYPAPPLPGGHFSAVGNTNQLVANAHNLPFEINHGNTDQLVPVSGVVHQADTFNAAGNAYVFNHYSSNDHFIFIFNDRWQHTRDFLGTGRRVRNPVEVVYRRFPAVDQPRNGLRFDRAYWVSRIAVRGNQEDPANSGLVDAVTHGFGGHLAKPVDLPSSPLVDPPNSPGTTTGQRQAAGAAVAKGNAFDVRIANVRAATFALARMGLDARRRLTIRVTADGPSVLTLRGSFPAGVSVSGATLQRVAGGVALGVAAGKHTVTLTP